MVAQPRPTDPVQRPQTTPFAAVQPRSSKRKAAGAVARDAYMEADRLRQAGQVSKADAVHARANAAAKPRSITDDSHKQLVRRQAAEIENMLWLGSGDPLTAMEVLAATLNRMAQREMQADELWLDLIGDLCEPAMKGNCRAVTMAVGAINSFMDALKHRGGPRTEDDNALMAVATAISGTTADMKGNKAAFMRVWHISRRRLKRSIAINDKMKDGSKHWKRVIRHIPQNKNSAAKAELSQCVHGMCRAYNGNGRSISKVPIGVTDDGTVLCELHPPLESPGKAAYVWEQLTGRDRKRPKATDDKGKSFFPLVNQPAARLARIVELWGGKEPTLHDVREALQCPCIWTLHVQKCVEPKAFQFQQQLAVYKKASEQWHANGCNCGCSKAITLADGTAGFKRNGPITQFSASPKAAVSSTQCPPVEIPEFAESMYNPKTGAILQETHPVKMCRRACHHGECPECLSWDLVFGCCPLQTKVTTEGDPSPHFTTSIYPRHLRGLWAALTRRHHSRIGCHRSTEVGTQALFVTKHDTNQ